MKPAVKLASLALLVKPMGPFRMDLPLSLRLRAISFCREKWKPFSSTPT